MQSPTKPKPHKQVRFKESSSSAVESDNDIPLVRRSQETSVDSDNEIQLSRRPQETHFVKSATYSSSDTDSVDIIHNAQPCKYGEQKHSTDDGNDEQKSDMPQSHDVSTPSTPVEELEPTPIPPESITEQESDYGPMTSTPKESVTGVYSLIVAQPRLSTL